MRLGVSAGYAKLTRAFFVSVTETLGRRYLFNGCLRGWERK